MQLKLSNPADAQKVLLIDDSVMIHRLVRVHLSSEPVELFTAADAATGLELALRIKPDLVLLDIEMPDADGFDVYRRLTDAAGTTGTPVIFLSARSTPEQKAAGLDLGAVDYIAKPFDAAELRARVRASLRTKMLLDLLASRAMIDGLTGLWNRAYLEDRLAAEVARSRRYRSPLSLILVDIDRFKSVNDSHGHPFGDQVLRQVGRTLATLCRDEDAVCRYGGEEFAVIAAGTDLAGAVVLAERMRLAVGRILLVSRSNPVKVTASFGVTAAADDTPASLLARTDAALYRAKAAGRDRVESGDPLPVTSAA